MKFKLKGRVDNSEFYNGKHITVVTTPAPDAYSQPSSFKLYSEHQLGAPGNEIEVAVAVRGFVREKRYTDKNTGQQKVFHEDNVFFDVVQNQAKVA